MLMRCLRKIQLECNLSEWELPAGDRAEHPALRVPAMPRTDALCALALGAPTALRSLQPFLLLNSLSDSISRPKGTTEQLFTGRKWCLQGYLYSHRLFMWAQDWKLWLTPSVGYSWCWMIEFVSFKMHIKCLEVVFPHDFLGMMYVPPMQVLSSV